MSFSIDRKRAPLPPQATTFLTSATSPVYARDAPSHSSAAPVAPRSLRPTDSTGPDGNVPLGPRRRIHANEEPAPRSGATGSVEYRDRGRNTSRQLDRGPNTHNYPISLPLIDTAMGQEEPSGMKETRRDKYPKVILLPCIQISWLFMNSCSRGPCQEADPLNIRGLQHRLVLVQITFRLEIGSL